MLTNAMCIACKCAWTVREEGDTSCKSGKQQGGCSSMPCSRDQTYAPDTQFQALRVFTGVQKELPSPRPLTRRNSA